MTLDELSVSDVLADNSKNFCNVYVDNEVDDKYRLPLIDSLYYTETDYVDLINQESYTDSKNLSIIL